MESAIVLAITVYHFDQNFLLDLDIFSFDRLMEMSRKARNEKIVEEAIAMRNAMNADQKEFKKFLDHYSNVTEEDKVAASKAKLKRMLGG